MQFGALAGVRVIDASRVLGGPYCGQILADHGADVIKIEPPRGDDTRKWGPPFKSGVAAYFAGVNRNKRAITLDLTTDSDRARFHELLADADVLIENFKPGTLEKWQLDYENHLSKKYPRLVHCALTGFGKDGPLGGLPGYDAVAQARSGLMSINGEAGGQPLRIGVPVVDLVSGMNAALGILMALLERGRSGKGQSIDITLYDSAIALLHPHLANHFYDGKIPARTGNSHPNIAPYDVFKTKGGTIFLAVGNDGQFKRFCEIIGKAEWIQDQRYVSNASRCQNRVALKHDIEAIFSGIDQDDLVGDLMREGIPAGPVFNIKEMLDDSHVQFREMVVHIDDYVGVASPIKLSRTPASYRRRPPEFNEHYGEVIGQGEEPGG